MKSERVVQRMQRQTAFGPDDLTLSLVTKANGDQRLSIDIDETTDSIGGRQQAGYLLDRTQIAVLILGLMRAYDELPITHRGTAEEVVVKRMKRGRFVGQLREKAA